MGTTSLEPTEGNLQLKLRFERERITRSFNKDGLTRFENSYLEIAKSYRKTLENSLNLVFGQAQNVEKNLFETLNSEMLHNQREVPWYLFQFFDTVKREDEQKRPEKYVITIKACSNYHFYALDGRNGEDQKMVKPPYFRPVSLPWGVGTKKVEEGAVTGFNDIVLLLAPHICELEKKESVSDLSNILRWFRIELVFEPNPIRPGVESQTAQILLNTTVNANFNDRRIGIPSNKNNVLVSSPNFREAIEGLSEAWLNPSAKNILISAWIGSGKEVLVDLLEKAVNPSARLNLSAAAEGNFATVAAKLIHELGKKKNKNSRVMLFLDEIHHGSAENIRSGLLRVLETNELEDAKGRVKPSRNVLYVFAASVPPERLRTLNPPDFWTRMEFTVEMKHPLLIKNTAEREATLGDYFTLFWERDVDDWKKLKEGKVYLAKVLEDYGVKDSLAKGFVEVLGSPLIPIISVRILRIVIKRLFFRTVEYVRTHPKLRDAPTLADDEDFEKSFKGWVAELSLELVLKGETGGAF